MSAVHYVYIWYHHNKPVYVGMGKGDRWRHGNSGQSHVYGLNKIHFLEGSSSLHCKIVGSSLTRQAALKLEGELIGQHKTPFNKENNGNIRSASAKNIARVNAQQGVYTERQYQLCYSRIKPLIGVLSNAKIAIELNKLGLKTPRGATWTKGSVWYMLQAVSTATASRL